MKIVDVATGLKKAVLVNEVHEDDFKTLTKKRYFFNWKHFKDAKGLFKLRVEGEQDILGVMYLIDVPDEMRIEIKLLACSIENTGREKVYDGIAGCLIAYACRLALIRYKDLGCVSLVPKTALKEHYIDKYNMVDAGWQLYLEGEPLNRIVIKYL